MSAWQERSIEQRNLLNPAFCAIVVWHLVQGYRTEATALGSERSGLPLALAFVGASLILRGQTREQLPRSTATSLATWVHDHPLERSAVAKGVAVLRATVREALLFGAQHRLLSLEGQRLDASDTASKKVSAYLRTSTVEVRDCMRQATLVGRWLCKAGAPSTVLTLLGVKP